MRFPFFILLVFFLLTSKAQNAFQKMDSLEKLASKYQIDEYPDEVWKRWAELTEIANQKYAAGNFVEAAELYRRTYFVIHTQPANVYNAACSWALADSVDNAFRDIDIWLAANKQGLLSMQVRDLEADKDFTNLHKDARWEKLLASLYTRVKEKNNFFYWGIYLGILLILFVYNFFLFISIKDYSYLFYSLLILVLIHFESIRSAVFGDFVVSTFKIDHYVRFISDPFDFFVALLVVFYTLFFNRFVKLREEMPRIYRFHKFLIAFFILEAIQCFFIRLPVINKFCEKITFLTFIYLFVLSIYRWKKGYKPARYFVLASSVITVSTLLLLLTELEIIKLRLVIGVYRFDNIGMMFFLGLLSFALGDKINLLSKEKAEAQQKAMEKLEELVQERTHEVVEKSKIIEEKNNDILASIHYAKRIQTSLITSQKYISRNLERLRNKF